MNMKKTIAAVAACAMAVSAMATTVSAADENATQGASWTYSLTTKSEAKTADLTFTAKSVAGGATKMVLTVDKTVAKKINDKATVTVADKSTKTAYTFTFTSSDGSSDYDGTTSVSDANGVFTYTIDLTKAQATSIKDAFSSTSADLDITFTMSDIIVTDAVDQTALNVALGNITTSAGAYTKLDKTTVVTNPLVNLTVTGLTGVTTTNAKGAVKTTEVKKPMKTIANTTTGTTEIFELLATKGVKTKDSAYVNAKAVINDMIANYDDVVFTFNTATDSVFTKDVLDANDAKGTWYTDSIKREYTDYYVTGVPSADPSWMGDSSFKAFPQHLYNLYGDEATKYTYTDSYVFNNLFNAALVANNKYTMNQSTITPFEYDKTSVSFSWSDLTGGNSFITAASTLDTLQLATSSDWYWDSMDVTGYTLAADDASTDAGIEDDGADLDDDAADDADVSDDDVADDDVADDDAAADDVADDDAAADDTAADDTAADSNPATGNAPIALAVIPVALAAAAVVAKKRG